MNKRMFIYGVSVWGWFIEVVVSGCVGIKG